MVSIYFVPEKQALRVLGRKGKKAGLFPAHGRVPCPQKKKCCAQKRKGSRSAVTAAGSLKQALKLQNGRDRLNFAAGILPAALNGRRSGRISDSDI